MARRCNPRPPERLGFTATARGLRVYRRLVTDGWLIEDAQQPWLDLEETDALDPLRAASIRCRVALVPHAGRWISPVLDPPRCLSYQLWAARFVRWHSNEHRHSGIGYMTPAQRHACQGVEILPWRHRTYEPARAANPRR